MEFRGPQQNSLLSGGQDPSLVGPSRLWGLGSHRDGDRRLQCLSSCDEVPALALQPGFLSSCMSILHGLHVELCGLNSMTESLFAGGTADLGLVFLHNCELDVLLQSKE